MSLQDVHNYIDEVFPTDLERTRDFLRIPSVSNQSAGLVDAARWLREAFQSLGAVVEFAGREEAPIVYARLDLGKASTLLVYGMYDVQPAEPSGWIVPPFSAEIRALPEVGESIIARGACNSKGPLLGFLNTLAALKRVGGIPANIILTIEGEEEAGSPTLPLFYQENKVQLRADAGFEPFWAEYGTDVVQPTISLGTKGIVSLDLICRGGEWGGPVEHPVHSSIGAWVSSPLWRLLRALNTLVDADETFAIEGFQDQVAPPRAEDQVLLERLAQTFDEERVLKEMGARRYKYQLHGVDLLRTYIFSPTIGVGFPVETPADAIPNQARANVVIRLVPEMDPSYTVQKLREHLRARGFSDIQVVVRSSYPPARTSADAPVVQCMIEAYRYHKREPQVLPLLASATPYYLFSNVLCIPFTWGGLGKAGGSHAPNEFASVEGLKLFEKSIATFLYCFADHSSKTISREA